MWSVLIFALAMAQDTAPPSRLELGDAYRLARAASPRAAAARELAMAAEARAPGARRPPDPEIQLGFMNYGLPDLAPMDPLGMTQLQVMQMFPAAGKLKYSGRVADAQAAAAGERARDVAWSVRSQVAMAFYDLYATDRRLAVARETLRLLQDIRATADVMYRVGEGRQADGLKQGSHATCRDRLTRRKPKRRDGPIRGPQEAQHQPDCGGLASAVRAE